MVRSLDHSVPEGTSSRVERSVSMMYVPWRGGKSERASSNQGDRDIRNSRS